MVVVHLVHDDFRVGLRSERETGRQLLLAQCLMVLNDTVTHQRHGVLTYMRVGVPFGHSAMSRPACVGKPDMPFECIIADSVLEHLNFAYRPGSFNFLLGVNDRDPGRIIAAVFETFQTF